MTAKKVSVVFVKRTEDRDGKGNKIVTEIGTKADLTEAELHRVKHAVKVIGPSSAKAEAKAKAPAKAEAPSAE